MKRLTDCGGSRAATRGTHIDTGDMKPGGERLFEIMAMLQAAKSIIDTQPERKFPQPAFCWIDFAGRLHHISDPIMDAKFLEFTAAISTGNLSRHHPHGSLRIRHFHRGFCGGLRGFGIVHLLEHKAVGTRFGDLPLHRFQL